MVLTGLAYRLGVMDGETSTRSSVEKAVVLADIHDDLTRRLETRKELGGDDLTVAIVLGKKINLLPFRCTVE